MLVDRQTTRGSVKLSVKWYNLGNNVNRHVANMEKGFLMSQAKMEDIISLCKRRGFIYQGSDVYGGLSGTWDYGPLGVQLKRNIMNLWWRMFVDERDDIYGVDAAILMNPKVWKASGHVDTFVDPLCEDVVNHRRYRTDHILKDNGVDVDGLTMEQMDEVIAEHGIKSPDGNPLSKSRTFNMMFKTSVGATESEDSVAYLRPETAQGIFTNFKNVVDSFYPDLPLGLDPKNIHELDVPAEDRAHYSKKTIDIEYDFPIGKEELMGIAYRTDFDLMNIQRVSGKSMEYTIKGTNEKFVPHVIEPSFGVERALMAVLSSAYREDEQNGSKRVYLALPEHLAPVKFAVSPLLKNKPELVEKAREIYTNLSKKNPGRVMWDDNGNIGKRYRRQDEIGTPHCVVIDFQTLEDDTVTVRERDTTEQRRVKVEEL